MSAFLKSLKRGDLTVLTSPSSKFAHLGELTQQHKEKEKLWLANLFCGFEGKYYFHPRGGKEHLSIDCKKCAAEFVKRNNPTIKGWNDKEVDASSWPLPFGWKEVPVVGHPWDVPKDVPIETVRNDEDEVVGSHCYELRRWQRGQIVVRIVEYTDEEKWSIRSSHVEYPLKETYVMASGFLERCVEKAWRLMAIGGKS